MRCTASLLLERRSWPIRRRARREAALLAVGRCHNHNVDKFAALKLTKLSLVMRQSRACQLQGPESVRGARRG